MELQEEVKLRSKIRLEWKSVLRPREDCIISRQQQREWTRKLVPITRVLRADPYRSSITSIHASVFSRYQVQGQPGHTDSGGWRGLQLQSWSIKLAAYP